MGPTDYVVGGGFLRTGASTDRCENKHFCRRGLKRLGAWRVVVVVRWVELRCGMWMLDLDRRMEVRTVLTGCYYAVFLEAEPDKRVVVDFLVLWIYMLVASVSRYLR